MIATWFSEREAFPESIVLPLEKVLDLAYGENPHQRAAYYADRGVRSHLLSRVEQLHGKALSFNNLNDLSAARLRRPRVHAPRLRDRQAREPVRRRGRRDDRGGVRESARVRSGVRVRRRRGPEPRRPGAARGRSSPSSSSRCCSHPATTTPRSRRCGESRARASSPTGNAAEPRRRVVASSACSAACSCRTPTPRSRTATVGGRCAARPTSGSGATSCSRGACASTSPRTRSWSRRISPRSASAPAR